MNIFNGVAPIQTRDFYCIFSAMSDNFYTEQRCFMQSLNTCLYKVVCCSRCVQRQLQACRIIWLHTGKVTYGTEGVWRSAHLLRMEMCIGRLVRNLCASVELPAQPVVEGSWQCFIRISDWQKRSLIFGRKCLKCILNKQWCPTCQ